MPDIDKLLLFARDLRARGEEVLAQSDTMKDEEARQMMRKIAARYETLAQRLEKESGGAGEA